MSSEAPLSPSPSPLKEHSDIPPSASPSPSPLKSCDGDPPQQQDFHPMDPGKRASLILQSPSFREELDSLIQEQMKKGNNSSNLWALRQIGDFLASQGAPATLPVSPSSLMVIPINDLHGTDPTTLAKGERLMRCKLTSVYRLLDLYGWSQLARTYLTLRVSKEQDHFLIVPQGLSYSEVTASSLVKVNVLGELVEKGSTALEVDRAGFRLHSAIYSARPDVRCLIHLHTPATAAVSAMKCGILPVSHEALLVGEAAYFSYNGDVEGEEDRVELQKSLGPTCKVLVLRNHGVLALGESVEEAFYRIYHIQSACEIQVSALCSAGGVDNLILLDRERQRPHQAGSVGWAGSTFGPMQKCRAGEHEFEALMRTLDNLGYRTGYAYRHPVLQGRSKPRSEVQIPATVTAFSFEEEPVPRSAPRHHAQRQQHEKTRWLNTPNTYLRISQSEGSPGTKTTWLRAEEAKPSSGSAIKTENPNLFVPLFTDPREVLETRNKIREQNRQDMKSAGPQSQLLASVITDKSRSPSADTELAHAAGLTDPGGEPETAVPDPETPNPFNQLTDQELEEYREEVQKKQRGRQDGADNQLADEGVPSPSKSPPTSPSKSPPASPTKSQTASPTKSSAGLSSDSEYLSLYATLRPYIKDRRNCTADKDSKTKDVSKTTPDGQNKQPEQKPAVVLNGKEEDQTVEQELSKGMKELSTQGETGKTDSVPPVAPTLSPEGSPSKSPSKKKKKFKAPSFLKKSKKKEKAES